MNDITSSSDTAWLAWIEVQRRAHALRQAGDLVGSLAEINAFLQTPAPQDLQSEAFAARADLLQESGDLEGARRDFDSAWSASQPASYNRYTLEFTLGVLSERLGAKEVGAEWCRRAVRTALISHKVSAASAVDRLIRLTARPALTDEDRLLCERAVLHSWKVLGLRGTPDLSQLLERARELILAQGVSVQRRPS